MNPTPSPAPESHTLPLQENGEIRQPMTAREKCMGPTLADSTAPEAPELLPLLEKILAVFRAADDDIRGHLQVARFNRTGKTHTGEQLEIPNPPLQITEHGIRDSEMVCELLRGGISIVKEAIAAWNTRATAPAPASHEEWRKESYAKWLRAREKPHVPEDTKSTGITLPAPASGWMEEIARAHYYGIEGTKVAQAGLVRLIARHAPDVAKLEAELEGCNLAIKGLKSEKIGLEAEVAELKRMLGGDNEGALLISDLTEECRDLKRQLVSADREIERLKIVNSALDESTEVEELTKKTAALEAENARLRALLKKVHDKMLNWFSSEYAAHPDTQEVTQALAASPAPSAWREMDSAPKDSPIDIYSAGRSIRWMDCRWKDGAFWSQQKWVDEHGRRNTLFREVIDATHWQSRQPLPEPPAREDKISK